MAKCRPWSYSRLSTWEECPRQFQYSYIENLPSSRPDSPAATRGSAIHDKADKYLKGQLTTYPFEFVKVSAHLISLKEKKAWSEMKLAVKQDWTPCDYKDGEAYFRAIIDVLYMDNTVAHIEDHKTGQTYPDHVIQLGDYVPLVAAHYPADEYVTRLIYVDQGIVTPPKITKANRIKPIRMLLDGRIKNAEDDDIFPLKPGQHCKWCNYSMRYGGPCAY